MFLISVSILINITDLDTDKCTFMYRDIIIKLWLIQNVSVVIMSLYIAVVRKKNFIYKSATLLVRI